MSDAITLDVLSSSPVQLDVGDADPIAREEIAALATRVTTVEGDVSGLSTRMGAVEGDVTALDGRLDTAEGDISTLGTTVDGIDARVEAIEADYVTSEDVMGALGGEAPTLVSGSSRAVLGDAETASWMQRTTAADGAALIESVKGNTLRWNQLIQLVNVYSSVSGVSLTIDIDTGYIAFNGTTTSSGGRNNYVATNIPLKSGHKYLIRDTLNYAASGNETRWSFSNVSGSHSFIVTIPINQVYQYNNNDVTCWMGKSFSSAGEVYDCSGYVSMYDLTQMFGVGNEPATVAEFEALFPEPYYPYDPGSLLPVRMEGIETVAEDESWSSQRTIPAATYFPQGLRSAGSVRDELRADAAITRIGERAYQSGDESDASVITDGTVTHYALATPTTTPIDPPLPLSYRTGAGGTERVMVASGTTSAPPIFATRYPLDPADLAASIAPRESATAEANHAVGDLVMLGWTLCKVTTAIARGEAITIGTNVTKTSVAAELAALS